MWDRRRWGQERPLIERDVTQGVFCDDCWKGMTARDQGME